MEFAESKLGSFLPSEIARLVYGYLSEEGCFQVAKAFLETSYDLQECASIAKRGRGFSSKILGYNLVQLLDLIADVATLVRELASEFKWGSPGSNQLEKLLKILKIERVGKRRRKAPEPTEPVEVNETPPTGPSAPDTPTEASEPKMGNLLIDSSLLSKHPPLEQPSVVEINGAPYTIFPYDKSKIPFRVQPQSILPIESMPAHLSSGVDLSNTLLTAKKPCMCKCRCLASKTPKVIQGNEFEYLVMDKNKVVKCFRKPKMRPIVPKFVQHLEGGVRIQAVHTKENPLVDLRGTCPKTTSK